MKQGRDRNDHMTLNLLDWKPPSVIERFDEDRIKATTVRDRIAHAVAATFSESPLSRDEIAQKMTEFLGEDVSKHMLDAYASEAREDHTIPYHRLLALVYATGDIRPLQLGAELFDYLIIEGKFGKLIELGIMVEHAEEAERISKLSENAVKSLLKQVRQETFK